jgi:putative transferase (TIGR04331 family)
LREAGILYDSPEKAGKKVNEIFENPWGWWNQYNIQTAKDRFCYQFARTSDNWLEEWNKRLLD